MIMKRNRKIWKFYRLSLLEFIIVAFFFLLALRTLTWFQPPNFLTSGDLRSPIDKEAFLKRALYQWDEIDFGLPSVYAPRMLEPFFLFITIFQGIGLNLYSSQMVTLILMHFLSTIIFYIFVRQITRGNIIASVIASVYLISNVYLINDREITAISFMNLILLIFPSLVAFLKGIKISSSKFIALSGILGIFSYATFPNYRTVLIFLMMQIIILFFLLIEKNIKYNLNSGFFIHIPFNLKNIKLFLVFSFTFLSSSLWIFTLCILNLDSLLKTYLNLQTPWFLGGRQLIDVMRLIVRWGFDSGALGKPYIPYSNSYLKEPTLVFLSFLPIILAFSSLFVCKERKIILFFGFLSMFFLSLTSGLSFLKFGSYLYFELMNLPFLKTFREASNWTFFVIISNSILIGYTISSLCNLIRNKTLNLLLIFLIILNFLYISYPLTTGDISRNWLNHKIKGTYLPSSYQELNYALSSNYWSILIPRRYSYVAYNFSNIPFSCGNPYPFIFSKPFISGVGTEYLSSQSLDLIDNIYKYIEINNEKISKNISKVLGFLGIKYIIVETNLIYGILSTNSFENFFNQSYINLTYQSAEIKLFENNFAVPKLHIATTVYNYSSIDNMFKQIEKLNITFLKSLVFSNLSAFNISYKQLFHPTNFYWEEVSPISYRIEVISKGPFILILNQNYSKFWKLNINGKTLSENKHFLANSYANAWLIEESGNLVINIFYETQNFFLFSLFFSSFPILFLVILFIKDHLKLILNFFK